MALLKIVWESKVLRRSLIQLFVEPIIAYVREVILKKTAFFWTLSKSGLDPPLLLDTFGITFVQADLGKNIPPKNIKDLPRPPYQTYCTAGEGLLTLFAGLWARAQACPQNRKKRNNLEATVLKQGSEQHCK